MENDKRNSVKKMSLNDSLLPLSTPDKCIRCRKDYVYDGLGKYVCEKCGDVFLDEYGKVREFIDEHGSAYSIVEISEMTGVSRRYIDAFIREGKFDKVNRVRRCKKCGELIETGEYCRQCTLRGIQDEMSGSRSRYTGMLKQDNVKGEMHYFDQND